jgi:hypothetical protein
MEYKELKERLDDVNASLREIKERRDKIQGALYQHGALVSKNNARIPELLERLYIFHDESARKELHEHNNYIQELKQFKMFGSEILRRAEQRIRELESKQKVFAIQVSEMERNKKHWNNEYVKAKTRFKNSDFGSFEVTKKRFLECAAHKYVNKLEEAEAIVDAKVEEFNEKAKR